MRKATQTNVNTQEYWDMIYDAEELAQKQRVDQTRSLALNRFVRLREDELQRAAQVLDVGCGLGDALDMLRQRNHHRHIAGVDISASAIEYCQRVFGSDRAEWHCMAAQDVGKFAKRFDIVWCGETLEHLEAPTSAVMAMATACADGGFIVLSTPFKQRNTSVEHVWEFEPKDVQSWADIVGELVFLDCCLLTGWLTMFAVIRVGKAT